MPTMGWGHSHYWSSPSGPAIPPPPVTVQPVGYIPFQRAVVLVTMGMGFGVLQWAWDRWVSRRPHDV